MLPVAGMPTGTVFQCAVLRREVETIDFLVAMGGCLVAHTVQLLAHQRQLLAVEHRTAQQHNLGLGVVAAHLLEETAVGRQQTLLVVVVGRGVVGAKVDAHHVRGETAEIPRLCEIVEIGIFILLGHLVGTALARTVVAAIDADARTGHHLCHGSQVACRLRRVGVIVVLGGILEGVGRIHALIAVTAGDGVADELDAAVGQGGRCQQAAALVEYEPAKLGTAVQPLHAVHQPHRVLSLCQCHGQCHHRVFLAGERHFKRLAAVDGGHEIAALGLGYHAERCALKAGVDLYAGIGEQRRVGVAEVDASDVLDMAVGGGDDGAADGHGDRCAGCQGQQDQGQECDCFFHFLCCKWVFPCKNTYFFK